MESTFIDHFYDFSPQKYQNIGREFESKDVNYSSTNLVKTAKKLQNVQLQENG